MESEQDNADISKLNIYQRIREVKREVNRVDKAGRHTQGFSFMKHDDVTAALSGLFVKWGIDREVDVIEVKRHENILEVLVELSWVNVDQPTDRKTVRFYAEGVNIIQRDGGENRDGLAAGKAVSYAVKMAELKNFCLVGDTTPDAERTQPQADVAPPSDQEYGQLVELYKSCGTKPELDSIRAMVSPLVQQNKLTTDQKQELSKLDQEARSRIK